MYFSLDHLVVSSLTHQVLLSLTTIFVGFTKIIGLRHSFKENARGSPGVLPALHKT
jgi:hypothetical protein